MNITFYDDFKFRGSLIENLEQLHKAIGVRHPIQLLLLLNKSHKIWFCVTTYKVLWDLWKRFDLLMKYYFLPMLFFRIKREKITFWFDSFFDFSDLLLCDLVLLRSERCIWLESSRAMILHSFSVVLKSFNVRFENLTSLRDILKITVKLYSLY